MIYPTAIAEAKIAIAAAKDACPHLTTEGIGAQPFGHLVFSGPQFEEARNDFDPSRWQLRSSSCGAAG